MDAAGGNQRQAYEPPESNTDAWVRSWSPDGRYVAFTRISFIQEGDNWYWTNAYLQAWDSTNPSNLMSLGYGNADWSPDWQSADLQAPASGIEPLPAQSPWTFTVQWSGADAGPAGIAGFDVQVKDGSGRCMDGLAHGDPGPFGVVLRQRRAHLLLPRRTPGTTPAMWRPGRQTTTRSRPWNRCRRSLRSSLSLPSPGDRMSWFDGAAATPAAPASRATMCRSARATAPGPTGAWVPRMRQPRSAARRVSNMASGCAAETTRKTWRPGPPSAQMLPRRYTLGQSRETPRTTAARRWQA